ncbi:MAG: Rpn family recombination-promoting nuclease/putative transposase [Candidatus Cloacimonetes bacterium]|nr:Rpn family recombination-promoting nuclease/putative transposase [Candidatus Cloacimonadota bacterium]
MENKENTAIKKDKVDLIRFDWAMKTILRNKANFDVLEGFLSSLLKQDITIIEIIESESNQKTETDKFNRADFLVKDDQGRNLIIEIQNTRETDYLERILYGTSKKITESVELGETYRNVIKVISISILYFNLGRGDDYIYYGTTKLKGVHTGHPLLIKEKIQSSLQTLEFQMKEKDIFPEYYFINIYKFSDEVNDDADEWIYFFKNNTILDSFRSKNIQTAKDKFDIIKMSRSERRRYENFLMKLMSEKDMVDTAKEEGKEEGRKEGRKEERIIQEKKRKSEKLEIARNLLDVLDTETISRKTGLTKEEIENLK